jgi:NADH-quinone oxidoreductase subunit H
VVESAPLWSAFLIPVALLVLAGYAAVLDSRSLVVPARETVRLLIQQRRTTVSPDALVWRAGGGGLLVAAGLMLLVVPAGWHAVSDLPIGVVWFNMADVGMWALLWLAGWGANSHYGLVGGYRFLSQALAYEFPLMFALTAPALGAQSLRVGRIVAAQDTLWYVVWMPAAFLGFLAGVAGFAMWGPLSYPAGSDIAGGVAAELSGPDRLVFSAGRYALLSAGAAFAVPLFLGGGRGPLLPAWLWSLLKTLAVLTALVWAGRRLPILRAERFTELGWLVLMPLTLLQLLVVALVVIA